MKSATVSLPASTLSLIATAGIQINQWMEKVCDLKVAATTRPLTGFEARQLKLMNGGIAKRKAYLEGCLGNLENVRPA